MIRLESSKMAKAIERAKSVRPFVKCAAERVYKVRGTQGEYTVRFAVAKGMKLAECDCPAGSRNQVCYHVAAASALNIALHSTYSKPSTDEHTQLISNIKAAWTSRYPHKDIGLALLRRFGTNRLESLNVDFLRRIAEVLA